MTSSQQQKDDRQGRPEWAEVCKWIDEQEGRR